MNVLDHPSVVVASAVALLAASCSSHKTRSQPDPFRRVQFELLAREVNPTIISLRPVADRVLYEDRDDPATTLHACATADDSLRLLRGIRWPDDDEQANDAFGVHMDVALRDMLDGRPSACRKTDGSAKQAVDCRNWCLDAWLQLGNSIERLRGEAKRAGVSVRIESLSSSKVVQEHW